MTRLVPMGAIEVAEAPQLLEIRGLGSCVAIGIVAPAHGVAGLAHGVIPRALGRPLPAPGWSVEEAVPLLVHALEARGVPRAAMAARLAGGSAMFASLVKRFAVGEANARAAEAALERLRVPVVSRDLGGTSSRAVSLDPSTGRLDVRELGAGRLGEEAPEPMSELAHVLLHAACTPLARFLDRPLAVEGPSTHELPPTRVLDFLGGRDTRLVWSLSTLPSSGALVVALPEAHADALVAAMAPAADAPVPDADVLGEAMNLATSHAANALARMLSRPLVPGMPQAGAGSSRDMLQRVRREVASRQPLLVVHGRLHLEGVLRGVDAALLLPGLEGRFPADLAAAKRHATREGAGRRLHVPPGA